MERRVIRCNEVTFHLDGLQPSAGGEAARRGEATNRVPPPVFEQDDLPNEWHLTRSPFRLAVFFLLAGCGEARCGSHASVAAGLLSFLVFFEFCFDSSGR